MCQTLPELKQVRREQDSSLTIKLFNPMAREIDKNQEMDKNMKYNFIFKRRGLPLCTSVSV